MSKSFKWLVVCAAAASLAVPLAARAGVVAASCSVAVDYLVNANLVEAYRKAFVVQQGVPFADDFGNLLRFKFFSATATKQGGDLIVAIKYSSDVSVFDSIDFNTSLTVNGGAADESTFGSHSFATSTPTGFFLHTTNYTLSCRKV